MRAVIVGAVESTRVAVEAIAAAEWQIPLVATLPPAIASRHSDFVDLGGAAAAAGARLHRTERSNDAATLREIAEARPDFVFVIGWSQLCGADFLALAPGRVIGYHPAPLPRLRGRAVIPWTILLEEPISAGTLFWMDEGIDSGPILEQRFFHVAPDETAASLYARHMDVLREMMDRVLPALAAGNAPRRDQDERLATFAARRTREDGEIDWRLPARRIERLVRAVGRPYPGAFTRLESGILTIWSATPLDGRVAHHAQPGQIVGFEGAAAPVVATGDGLLRIDEWEAGDSLRPAMHAVLGRRGG